MTITLEWKLYFQYREIISLTRPIRASDDVIIFSLYQSTMIVPCAPHYALSIEVFVEKLHNFLLYGVPYRFLVRGIVSLGQIIFLEITCKFNCHHRIYCVIWSGTKIIPLGEKSWYTSSKLSSLNQGKMMKIETL